MTKETKPEVDEFDEIETKEVEAPAKADKAEKPVKAPAKADKAEKLPEGAKVITYIGQGETPPNKINFMGRQEFVRGRAIVVTDKVVLGKIEGNPCFIEGKVDPEELADMDEEAIKAANKQRKEDKKIDAAYKKMHG